MNNNKIIVPLEYTDFSTISKNLDNFINYSNFKSDIYFLNELIVVDNKDNIEVFNIDGIKIFKSENESYLSYLSNNVYLSENYDNNKKIIQLIDNKGKILFEKNLFNNYYVEYNYGSPYFAFDNSNNESEKSKYGIMDINQKEIVSFKYERIYFYNYFYVISKDNKIVIYDYNQKEIIPFGNY